MNNYGRGINQEKIQELNRTLILHHMRKEGVCARATLAKLSGLKQATVTYIINDFLEWGLATETGFISGDKGRRSVGVTLDRNNFGVLGIKISRKNYQIGIFDLVGDTVVLINRDIAKGETARSIFNAIKEEAKTILAGTGKRKILAIGAAIPGPYSLKKGRIALMTGMPGWDSIPIQQELQEAFGLNVFIEQDANAGALAQYWYTPEISDEDALVYIAAGYGIGAGIITNGSLLKGAIGVAGEIGHASINYNGPQCACGNYGCLENYASATAFTNEINRIMGDEQHSYSFADARSMVRDGNPLAKEIFSRCCDYLAVGIVNVINSVNPTRVIIGDEMSHIVPEYMLQRIQEEAQRKLLPEIYENTTISMSVVEDSMVHGAANVAICDIFSNPTRYLQ